MKLDWKPYMNKHKDQRCFILGNAPNLLDEDLSLLKNEKVFITNRGYKAKEFGLDHFDYQVIVDMGFYEDYADEISKVSEGVKFYPDVTTEYKFYKGESFVPMYTLPTLRQTSEQRKQLLKGLFPTSYEQGWGKTGNVVLNSCLVAYFMGFTEIYLMGVEMIYRAGSTHFYKDISNREKAVPDGHRSKGPKYLPQFVNFFKKNNVKFINLTQTFPYKELMKMDTLKNIIKEWRKIKSSYTTL